MMGAMAGCQGRRKGNARRDDRRHDRRHGRNARNARHKQAAFCSLPQCQIFFEVADAEAAHIIGKGGNFLQTLCLETGCKVVLSKRGESVPGIAARLVTVTGPVQGVHQAHLRVLERVSQIQG
eukprot:Skav227358  [mRNA]  locus=scaffold1121:41207:43564:+ [translate_table: standard]